MKVVRHVTRGAPGREAAGMKIALDPCMLRRVPPDRAQIAALRGAG
jgi:hypothetical protein